MQLTPLAGAAIQVCLVIAAAAVLLRGDRVTRWLRGVLVGLAWLLLDAVLAPLAGPGQAAGAAASVAPGVATVASALVAVGLVATAVEVRTPRSAVLPGAAALAVLTAVLLLLDPVTGRTVGQVVWTAGALLFGWTLRGQVRHHLGSLLEARLRLLAAAGWLLAASTLSAATTVGSAVPSSALLGPRGVVWGLPTVVATGLVLVAVAPPAFLRLAPRRTRTALRRTDVHLAAIGPEDPTALQSALEAVGEVLGGTAAVLVDDGTVVGATGEPDVVGIARDHADRAADGDGDAMVTATADGRSVLACSTRRGSLVVVLPAVGVLLSADDRDQVAAVAERFGVVLAREEARRADERAASSARAAERMRDDMLSTLSHELRTPLTTIMGFAEVLRSQGDALDADRVRLMLGRIVEKGTQLESIVSGLLDLTSVRGRSEPGRLAVYDLRSLVEHACGRLRERTGRTVEVTGSAGVVHTDGGAVLSVLEELLGNACKFSGAHTEVRVVVSDLGDGWVAVDVSDGGPGLGALGDEVFEPFVRGGDVLTRATDGVGIGLTIARELAGQLDGELTALPTVRGATLRLSMPRRHHLAGRGDLATPLDAARAEGDPTLVPSGRRGSPRVPLVRGSG